MGHLSMIVFQKCVVMPRIFGGYWGGSVDPEVNKVGKEQFDHSSPITKSKLVYTNNFNCFGKSLKNAPGWTSRLLLLNHQHQRSHIVTAYTRDTFLYHRFILSVLCYSSFLHWYDGPIYIYMLRPLPLLANNHLTSIQCCFSTTINPVQEFSIF